MRVDKCDFVEKLLRIDFIKIDVEGMELEVIEGGMAAIERHHPSMLIETLLTGDSEHDARIETMMGILSTAGEQSWGVDSTERDFKPDHPNFRFSRSPYP